MLWKNVFGFITTSVICERWKKKISVIYWRLPGRFCTKSSLSMRWCGKQAKTLSRDDTTAYVFWVVQVAVVEVAVNDDDELVMWRWFFPQLLNLKETLQKILQPFLSLPDRIFKIAKELVIAKKSLDFWMIIKNSQSVAFGDYLRGLPAGASLRSAHATPAARFARPPPPTARSARHPQPHHR